MNNLAEALAWHLAFEIGILIPHYSLNHPANSTGFGHGIHILKFHGKTVWCHPVLKRFNLRPNFKNRVCSLIIIIKPEFLMLLLFYLLPRLVLPQFSLKERGSCPDMLHVCVCVCVWLVDSCRGRPADTGMLKAWRPTLPHHFSNLKAAWCSSPAYKLA